MVAARTLLLNHHSRDRLLPIWLAIAIPGISSHRDRFRGDRTGETNQTLFDIFHSYKDAEKDASKESNLRIFTPPPPNNVISRTAQEVDLPLLPLVQGESGRRRRRSNRRAPPGSAGANVLLLRATTPRRRPSPRPQQHPLLRRR